LNQIICPGSDDENMISEDGVDVQISSKTEVIVDKARSGINDMIDVLTN